MTTVSTEKRTTCVLNSVVFLSVNLFPGTSVNVGSLCSRWKQHFVVKKSLSRHMWPTCVFSHFPGKENQSVSLICLFVSRPEKEEGRAFLCYPLTNRGNFFPKIHSNTRGNVMAILFFLFKSYQEGPDFLSLFFLPQQPHEGCV